MASPQRSMCGSTGCKGGPSSAVSSVMIEGLAQFVVPLFQTRIVFGQGKVNTLTEELDRLGVARVAFICTPLGARRYSRLIASLGDRCATVFAEAVPHSPVKVSEAAAKAVMQSGADATVCVGGGSTIGLGKFVAVTEGRPQIAVPTTLSGSELTPIYGFKSGHEKRAGVSPDAVPRVAIYDPTVAASLPARETAQSGMNSLAHSVEAFYMPNANRLSDVLATEGVRALFDGLPGCVERPSDLSARATAMYGGLVGGLLVAMVGIGLHHKICHVLGGRFGLPHGVLNGIILPQAIAFNAPAMPEAIDRLASAIGDDDPSAACFRLAKRLGLPLTLREVGVAEADLAPAVEDIVAAQVPNPRPTVRR